MYADGPKRAVEADRVISISKLSCVFFRPVGEKQQTAALIPIAVLYLMNAIG